MRILLRHTPFDKREAVVVVGHCAKDAVNAPLLRSVKPPEVSMPSGVLALPRLALAFLQDVGATSTMWAFKKPKRAADVFNILVWRLVDVDSFAYKALNIMQKPQRIWVLVVDVLIVYFVQFVAAKPTHHCRRHAA
jgi:hypothetical protein